MGARTNGCKYFILNHINLFLNGEASNYEFSSVRFGFRILILNQKFALSIMLFIFNSWLPDLKIFLNLLKTFPLIFFKEKLTSNSMYLVKKKTLIVDSFYRFYNLTTLNGEAKSHHQFLDIMFSR